MATLVGGVLLRHPETGEIESLTAGAEVPEWAVDLIGSHLLAEGEQPREAAPRGRRPSK